MVELINPPDPRSLLPPLLACLPLSFVSPQPPPALLPLLSPILRQRVQIISSVSSSPTDSWLRLLCWDERKAERIQDIVDGTSFEPHPVSGEIDLPADIPVTYKRIDEETLQSQVVLLDYSLTVIYLWCPDDKDGGGPGWRVAELLPEEGSVADDAIWSVSIGEANARAKETLVEDALTAAEKDEQQQTSRQGGEQEEEDDDADYWAQYDAAPSETPAAKTPAPNAPGTENSEASYFSQYANVQPAMDNHDPEEEQPELGASSLNGDVLANLLRRQINGSDNAEPARANGYSPGTAANEEAAMTLNHPRPSSVSSASSEAVARLEQSAESQSAFEMGVKQHIGSNIKSLFRLAKSTGMSRAEFQSLVKTELELLNVSDGE